MKKTIWQKARSKLVDDKSNWEKVQSQSLGEDVRFRDVYDSQQIGRSKIEKKKTMTLRLIFLSIICLFVFIVMYYAMGLFEFGWTYFEHTKQVGIVGEFNSVDDVLFLNGELIKWKQTAERDGKMGYVILDEKGEVIPDVFYETLEEANYPVWVEEKLKTQEHPDVKSQEIREQLIPLKTMDEAMNFDVKQFFGAVLVAGLVYLIGVPFLRKNLDAQNLMNDTTDINQYDNDQHIALPEEIQLNYDWFPDVGAHSSVQVSSMISHMALTNKGLHRVKVRKRATKDVLDENGDVLFFKGEPLKDKDGEFIYETKPIIDVDFMEELFDASGQPKDKLIRKYYNPTDIDYNRGNQNREKLKGFDRLVDLIHGDWELPDYEFLRPAGAYVVDTAPVNSMVLAITRGGKGQTVIEPTIDMWMREKKQNNMLINDPKGELLVKNYVKATIRGFQVIQFNLINSMKTDIYNPLTMAYQASIEGDYTKAAAYIENIADVFFPVDGADDPVWRATCLSL